MYSICSYIYIYYIWVNIYIYMYVCIYGIYSINNVYIYIFTCHVMYITSIISNYMWLLLACWVLAAAGKGSSHRMPEPLDVRLGQAEGPRMRPQVPPKHWIRHSRDRTLKRGVTKPRSRSHEWCRWPHAWDGWIPSSARPNTWWWWWWCRWGDAENLKVGCRQIHRMEDSDSGIRQYICIYQVYSIMQYIIYCMLIYAWDVIEWVSMYVYLSCVHLTFISCMVWII